jgi:23S rRNA pseudouridine1911/1915/1917 synthase
LQDNNQGIIDSTFIVDMQTSPTMQPAVTEDDAIELVVPEGLFDARLDRFLADTFTHLSRSRLQAWIEQGAVRFEDARKTVANTRVAAGDVLWVTPQEPPEQLAFLPEPVEFAVHYEDAQIIVVNKPAGLVVHPGAGNWQGTLLNGLLYRYAELARVPRAGIVHRLDKDTTGLMVVARTIEAQFNLVNQLKARAVSRKYIAFTQRAPHPPNGMVDAPLARDARNRLRMAVVQGGKEAVTHYLTVARSNVGEPARVHCALETGRTHQIRVHMAQLRAPLLADTLYGAVQSLHITRQALHAARLSVQHPATQQWYEWVAPLPHDMQVAARALNLLDPHEPLA